MPLSRVSTQTPKAYDLQNLQGSQIAARLAGSASAGQRGNLRTAWQDGGYLFKIHPRETAAGLVDAGLTFGFAPLDVRRYGADPTGVADSAAAINTASLVAAQGGGRVRLPAGTYKTSTTLLFYQGTNTGRVVFVGDGKTSTYINYTGAAAAVGVNTAGTRIYECGVRDMTIHNGGAGTVGLDMDSVSTSVFERVWIDTFPTGVRLHSVVDGGAVYNRFWDVTVNAPGVGTPVGFLVDTKDSNANEFIGCRYNGQAVTLGIAWQFIDSNGNSVIGCNVDFVKTFVDISAPSGAGFADSNTIFANRLESIGTGYNIQANVQFSRLGPDQWENVPATAYITDAGLRTNFCHPPVMAYEKYAGAGLATGNRRYENSADIGANPFFVVSDITTTTPGSTVVQIDSSSLAQTLARMRNGGVDRFVVGPTGAIGVNGVAPPAKVVGFGAPTGAGVILNFPGATATLAQCSQAIAQLITDLKNIGFYGA